MGIYEEIWEADMKCNGLRPVAAVEDGNPSEGYVVVNTDACAKDHHIFKEVYIPERKKTSYQLIEKLFDNYTLNQMMKEKDTRSELKEREDFLLMAIESLPVQLARQFIEGHTKKVFSEDQWYTYLHLLWFRQFNWESGRDLSGFEHIFIGEQKRRKLVGHHFWYKYYLEDNEKLNKQHRDQIELTCLNHNEQRYKSPCVITLGYHLRAFNYEKRRFVKILKKKCAFFTGISAEGLLAMGTVRASGLKEVPEHIVLNDVPYKLELYMSPDGKSIRTFYPAMLR